MALSLDVEDGDLGEIAKVKDIPNPPRVLVIVWPEDLHRVNRALDLGADEYLVKPFTAPALHKRLDLLFGRAARPDADGAAVADLLVIDPDRRIGTPHAGSVTFTDEEYRGLLALAEKSGRIATYRHLARCIWGGTAAKGRDDVRTLMAALRKKVEVDEVRPRFIQTDVGIGYRLGPGAAMNSFEEAEPGRTSPYDSTSAGP